MKYEIVTYPEYHIIGKELHIDSGNSPEEIGALWQTFFQDNIFDRIPHKISGEIVALYTDYESDHTQGMKIIIGAKVSSFKDMPEDLVSKVVRTATYARFVARGKFPECVGEAWHKIWTTELEWAYTNNFEVYPAQAQDPKDSKVDIYIAI